MLLAAAQELAFRAPDLDYHALAPEIVLTVALSAVLLLDLFTEEPRKFVVTQLTGIGMLAALVPVITLAVDGADRSMFGGAYVVDEFALLMKGLFLASGYVVMLMSVNTIGEGDYYEGEYGFLVLSSILGMVVMSSGRDLITMFVALELLSIPAYMLAGWKKRDLRSNEASLKYYLLGVLTSAVMLYGMSLVFGVTGTTILSEIGDSLSGPLGETKIVAVGLFFVIVAFAFKVSAVPFHFWAPDTYEGAPTPVTAFLSVASKTAGFVAVLELIFIAFLGQEQIWGPLFWALAALTMTVGNLVALRQTNIVRMLAYSSIAQAGYILVPIAVAGANAEAAATAQTASIVYLLIYAAMNFGAFAVVIAVSRRTNSGEISSYGGLMSYAPGVGALMTVFVFSLAGIPPFGGWFAKLYVFRAVADAGTPDAVVLGVLVGVNSVIALFYYASIAREMWMRPVPAGTATGALRVPPPLAAALAITAVVTLAIGVYPQAFARLGDLSALVR